MSSKTNWLQYVLPTELPKQLFRLVRDRVAQVAQKSSRVWRSKPYNSREKSFSYKGPYPRLTNNKYSPIVSRNRWESRTGRSKSWEDDHYTYSGEHIELQIKPAQAVPNVSPKVTPQQRSLSDAEISCLSSKSKAVIIKTLMNPKSLSLQ